MRKKGTEEIMGKLRRLVELLGLGGSAAFVAIVLPMAVAHAGEGDDGVFPGWGGGPYESCNGGVCLVMEPLTQESVENDWQYSGVRPYFTEWKTADPQVYNVQVDQGNGESINAGSYDIKISDTWTPLVAMYDYTYGDFVPNADAAGLDLGWFGDLSGATVNKTTLFDGAITSLTMNNVGPHDVSYWVFSTPDYTNVMVTADGVSADYIQFGDSDPGFLWNSLPHSGMLEAQVPDYVIPNDPFSGIDFDPSQYFGAALETP